MLKRFLSLGHHHSSSKIGPKNSPKKQNEDEAMDAAAAENSTSRTLWTAGVPSPPGRPVIELSNNRIVSPVTMATNDENSVTDEINIGWDVPQDDGGFPITGYRVEMLDLQSGCWVEITFIEGYEPKCTLSNILYGIMYRFRIVAMNDAGASEPGEPSEPVVVDVPGVQIAPYFVLNLKDSIVLEHERIEFRVRVLGTPKPAVQWFKDDMELFSCDRLELREEEEGGVVILKAARFSDSGVIKCVAANILGRAVSSAQLTVEASPRLELPEHYLEGIVCRHDEVIRLKIPLVAKPTPKVVWFFEEEPISPSGGDLQIETTEFYTCLRIENAKRWHCGEFRVYVENENGEDACSIMVTVTSPPSAPGKPVVIDISETRCTLRWEPSSDDGGADIKHYVLEYFRDAWNVWLKARATKDCQETIEDLIPGSRYKFRVKAENDYGTSDASEESDAFDVGGVASHSVDRQPSVMSEQQWPACLQQEQQPTVSVTDSPTIDAGTRRASLRTKNLWASGEDDILDRFLKVEQFKDLRIPSVDSDGIPSIAPIDEICDNLSDFSDQERQQHNSQQQQPSSTDEDNESSFDAHQDDSFAFSQAEKRREMNQFEETLKGMIKEACEMAKMEEDEEARPSQQQQQRHRKSPSAHSTTESVVSVVEARPPQQPPIISVTSCNSPNFIPAKEAFFGEELPPMAPVRSRPRSRGSSPAAPLMYEDILMSTKAGSPTKLMSDNPTSMEEEMVLPRQMQQKQGTPTAVRDSQESPLMVGIEIGGGVRNGTLVKTRQPSLPRQSLSRERPAAPVTPAAPIAARGKTIKHFEPGPLRISIDPTAAAATNISAEPVGSTAFRMIIPRNLPHWFLITYAYSVVLILILLVANINPDGKLYIHFTAFWSLVLYFVLDDDDCSAVDPIDSVVEGFVRR